jgi:hypothetical protein
MLYVNKDFSTTACPKQAEQEELFQLLQFPSYSTAATKVLPLNRIPWRKEKEVIRKSITSKTEWHLPGFA